MEKSRIIALAIATPAAGLDRVRHTRVRRW